MKPYRDLDHVDAARDELAAGDPWGDYPDIPIRFPIVRASDRAQTALAASRTAHSSSRVRDASQSPTA